MKKALSVLLCFSILFSLALPAGADQGDAAPSYFSISFDMMDDKTYISADFMIPADHAGVYINAENLAELSGSYVFACSYQQAAFVDKKTQHAVIFKFGSKEICSYILGACNTFEASIETLFYENVVWIPFDIGAQLLGCEYYVFNDHTAGFVQSKRNTLTALSALAYEEAYLAFDWCDEVGYDAFNHFVMSASAATVNFCQGLLTGSTWSAVLNSCASGTALYSSENANAIADCFVTTSKSELDSFQETYNKTGAFVKSIGLSLDETLTMQSTKWALQKLTGNSSIVEKVFKDLGDTLDKAWQIDSMIGELLLLLPQICSYYEKAENSDLFAVNALLRYSEKSSMNEAKHLFAYASDLKQTQFGALQRFCSENAGEILTELGTLSAEALFKTALAGPSATALGWELFSNYFPPLKGTLDSTEAFSRSKAAIKYQNDALSMWKSSCVACFATDGIEINQLENTLLDAYSYLKFSLIARGFAASCIQSSPNLKEHVKNEVLNKMKEMDARVSGYISDIIDADYGTLLGQFEGDDRGFMSLLLEYGEPIEIPSMDNAPILDMSGFPGDENGAVTVDEAIELVADTVAHLWC